MTNAGHRGGAGAGARATHRPIEGIYRPPPIHWVGDGFRVHGYFSKIPDAAKKLDPFLLLDYHPPHDYAPARRPRGVGVHPHRGFETVTLAWEGSVAHHDSAGGGGVIGPGDVQWMTAASGVLHKEYHEQEFARRGGTFHMAQLWVNLPRAHKMDPPRYQPLRADEMGIAELPGGAGTVRVIAGEFGGARGPAKTYTPIHLLDVRLSAGGTALLDSPAHYNTGLLVMGGQVRIGDGGAAGERDFIVFEREGERIALEAREDAHLLVMSGEPIREPIVQYGPFVMTTREDIARAFTDLETGKFGYLED